ncbi:SusC/RagA family TonB-linked outer membrane protein [Thalassobellus citreus]|uniref:SusC/RagA family TonB-linked outer membrane protein n=1 Tax=Thalassobellus citreus TaxID=3367752 RepID=UPI0037A820BE
MKTFIILFCTTMFSFAPKNTFGQADKIVIDNDQTLSIEDVLDLIGKQTDFTFIYSYNLFENLPEVELKKGTILANDLLEKSLPSNNFNISFSDEKTILIKKNTPILRQKQTEIRGIVTDINNIPIPGVSVLIKDTNKGVLTDINGHFTISISGKFATLQFVSLGYITEEVNLGEYTTINVVLKEDISELDEVVVIGYGTTTQRNATGSVSTVKAKVLEQQPTQNPMLSLQGRVSGLLVTAASGRPGANTQVLIRGVNSIGAGNSPLYIIDGIPFDSNPLNQFDAIGNPNIGNQSPLNSINSNDIESVSVLKDADATAIYGSRGANGVILITTKQGKNSGKLKVNINLNTGVGDVAHKMDLMNTSEYLDFRNQAFTNGGNTPNDGNAPDLTLWDQNQETDWQEVLLGGTAYINNANLTFSGGDTNNQFLLSGNYRKETTVYPGDAKNTRVGFNASYKFKSSDKKFGLRFVSTYSLDDNFSYGGDYGTKILTSPNLLPYDINGELNWENLGPYDNPLRELYRTYVNKTDNFNTNIVLDYKITPALVAKVSLGYNTIKMDQFTGNYRKYYAPTSSSSPNASFGNNERTSTIVEPQINYSKSFGKHNLNVLLGSTIQKTKTDSEYIYGSNYSTDALLESLAGAGTISVYNNDETDYRYVSAFTRVTYNYSDTYILNGTVRRDGSSRFGPGKRYGNFGSIGAAWVFSNESFLKDNNSFLSFGKLRSSYGTVGNDQIGNYQYQETWSSYWKSYQDVSSLRPQKLSNPNFRWEEVAKFDVALELGFFNNKVLLNANYYKNRTDNMLITSTLPSITGFTGITENLPAIVENRGWELELNTSIINTDKIKWNSSFNITIPKNELVKYDGLETSNNSWRYEIGQPIINARGFIFKGVNADTGVIEFEDLDDSESITFNEDRTTLGTTIPEFYGGLTNTFKYKNWTLDFLFQFVKKEDWDYKNKQYTAIGGRQNFGSEVYNGVQSNSSDFPAPTTAFNPLWYNYIGSTASWGDASYIKLKNVYLSYSLPKALNSKIGFANATIYFQGQNLVTFTNYLGLDPETTGLFTPPLRTFSLGLNLSF